MHILVRSLCTTIPALSLCIGREMVAGRQARWCVACNLTSVCLPSSSSCHEQNGDGKHCRSLQVHSSSNISMQRRYEGG